jgi:hypothetical protein
VHIHTPECLPAPAGSTWCAYASVCPGIGLAWSHACSVRSSCRQESVNALYEAKMERKRMRAAERVGRAVERRKVYADCTPQPARITMLLTRSGSSRIRSGKIASRVREIPDPLRHLPGQALKPSGPARVFIPGQPPKMRFGRAHPGPGQCTKLDEVSCPILFVNPVLSVFAFYIRICFA